jgi:uncharacterized membrane-anchored protein
MNRKIIIAGIALAIVFQVAVLASEYLGAVYPLWTGKEIRLKVVPVDPRSLFRGNYAQLRYDISTIDVKDLGEQNQFRNGEFVYIKLRPGIDGADVFDGAGLDKPATGLFIRGRIRSSNGQEEVRKCEVRYGIEAFFAPKEKALALERELRNGGIAVVMIADNGKSALKDIIPKQKNDNGLTRRDP